MHVIATAGHVDHGKSTLVRALTGMEPDRWAEERRRGMTIDLGFAWTELVTPRGPAQVAFVDVPGHERFVTNMLAGVGPVPSVLLVVAADEGWMPQTEEHVAALDALGVRHAVVAVTRSDRADPARVINDVSARLRTTSMGDVACVPVCAPTGAGLSELRGRLTEMTAALPTPDLDDPLRLWVDRSFSIRGAGTVVTGTLAAGQLDEGDAVELNGRSVSIRGLESLGVPVTSAPAVARVAVNLRGVDVSDVRRGDALLRPGAFGATSTVDVRLATPTSNSVPSQATLHIGSAAVAVRVRVLGADSARLTLQASLPLREGDVGLLRDPGQHRVVCRATVLDARPPALSGRGAGAARGRDLAALDADALLARHGILTVEQLSRLGAAPPVPSLAGTWVVDPSYAQRLRNSVMAAVAEFAVANPLEPGPTVEAVRRDVGLPDRALVGALLTPPLELRGGRIVDTSRAVLPPAVGAAVSVLEAELARSPYAAPEASRLAELGLGVREIAAAERAGALVRIGEGVVLLAGADRAAAAVLRDIGAPFTVSEARTALRTTRRVAVPLLELLDRRGLTRRGADDRRVVVPDAVAPGAARGGTGRG